MNLSISELNNMINEGIETNFPKKINVIGEISNIKCSRGHYYLNLKDNNCLVRAIIWKSKYDKLNIDLEDGNKISAVGHLNFYVRGGNISFIIDEIENKKDVGEIQKKYEKLKREFEKKGYFDINKKMRAPVLIRKITIITAKHAAALQDVLYVFKRYNMNLDINIIDVAVQGINCAKSVAQAIEQIEEDNDVILITRGGGDIEDLFGFSNSLVIEAIFNCPIFTISAIGHEVDFMLSDYVADHRAPTPSIAAEYIYLNNRNYKESLDLKEKIMLDKILQILNFNKLTLLKLDNELKNPKEEILLLDDRLKRVLLEKIRFLKNKINYLDKENELTKPDTSIVKININDTLIDSLKSFKKIVKKNKKIMLNFYDGSIEIEIK
jgi:exodeoxyribonuclease VII large subunit